MQQTFKSAIFIHTYTKTKSGKERKKISLRFGSSHSGLRRDSKITFRLSSWRENFSMTPAIKTACMCQKTDHLCGSQISYVYSFTKTFSKLQIRICKDWRVNLPVKSEIQRIRDWNPESYGLEYTPYYYYSKGRLMIFVQDSQEVSKLHDRRINLNSPLRNIYAGIVMVKRNRRIEFKF